MRYKRKAKVFGKMERIYSRKKYVEEIREFVKYNRVGRRI